MRSGGTGCARRGGVGWMPIEVIGRVRMGGNVLGFNDGEFLDEALKENIHQVRRRMRCGRIWEEMKQESVDVDLGVGLRRVLLKVCRASMCWHWIGGDVGSGEEVKAFVGVIGVGTSLCTMGLNIPPPQKIPFLDFDLFEESLKVSLCVQQSWILYVEVRLRKSWSISMWKLGGPT
ncbi:hypothetical protein Tco_0117570 [Tanacetum coccineum]